MIQTEARLPSDIPGLVRQLTRLHSDTAALLNGLSAGRIAASAAMTAAPTAGDWALGDFVRNSGPEELGVASSMYVILGWSCVAAGSPGTWVECRCLTGN